MALNKYWLASISRGNSEVKRKVQSALNLARHIFQMHFAFCIWVCILVRASLTCFGASRGHPFVTEHNAALHMVLWQRRNTAILLMLGSAWHTLDKAILVTLGTASLGMSRLLSHGQQLGRCEYWGSNSGTIGEVRSDLCLRVVYTSENGTLQGTAMDISTVLMQNNNCLIHILLHGWG